MSNKIVTSSPYCGECGRGYIHAMGCSKYAGAAPMAPAAIDAAMATDPGGYVNAQYAHNDDMSDPQFGVLIGEAPGPDGTTQLPLDPNTGNVVLTTEFREDGAYLNGERINKTQLPTEAEIEAMFAPDEAIATNGASEKYEPTPAEVIAKEVAPREIIMMYDHQCTLCPLHAWGDPPCKEGEWGGGPTSEVQIMVVVASPKERTMVDRVLRKADIDPASVFFTNAVKCPTPNDRPPNKKEIRACAHYLAKEIAWYRPSVIIPIGNEPTMMMTDQAKITLARGKRAAWGEAFRLTLGALGVTDDYDPFILPTLSPNSISHSPKGAQLEAQIVGDLELARREVGGNFVEIPVPWEWITHPLPVLVAAVNGSIPDLSKSVWSADIETNGKPTWHPDFRIGMIAIDTGFDPVGVFRGKDVRNAIELLKHVMEKGATVAGHNWSAYDRVGILNRTGVNLRGDDTMLLAHLLDEERGKSLETWATSELHVRPWKDELPEGGWGRMAVGNYTAEEWKKLGLYCARDTRYTRRLFLRQIEMIADDVPLFNYYKSFFLPFSRVLAAIEQRGVYIDQAKIERAWGKYEVQQLRAETAARLLTGDGKFNPGSSKQVRELLFDKLGLPPQQWTDEGDESTNEFSLKTLKYLVETDPLFADKPQVPALVNAILDYRGAQKYKGTYLEPYARIAFSSPITSRGFPQYSLVRSVSRTSSNGGKPNDPDNFGFNTQNRPRDLDIIGAAPGKVLVHADASQLELRTIAQCSGSRPMIEALNAGKDLHAELAMEIRRLRGDPHPEKYTAEERARAKPGNFGFGYGADEYTFEVIALKDYDMVVPRRESTLIRDAFHNRWQLRPWYERQFREARETGQVRSLSGRVRRLPNINSSDPKIRLEALRQAINFPAQELGLTIWGCVLIMAEVAGIPVVQEIHDSLDAEVLPSEVDATIAKLKTIEKAIPDVLFKLFGFQLVVPFIIDVSVNG